MKSNELVITMPMNNIAPNKIEIIIVKKLIRKKVSQIFIL